MLIHSVKMSTGEPVQCMHAMLTLERSPQFGSELHDQNIFELRIQFARNVQSIIQCRIGIDVDTPREDECRWLQCNACVTTLNPDRRSLFQSKLHEQYKFGLTLQFVRFLSSQELYQIYIADDTLCVVLALTTTHAHTHSQTQTH